jgi:hypothetical protein
MLLVQPGGGRRGPGFGRVREDVLVHEGAAGAGQPGPLPCCFYVLHVSI